MSDATRAPRPQPNAIDYERHTLRGRPRSVVRAILRTLLRPLIGFRIEGIEHVPVSGPLLLVSNHLHNADPILLEIAFPRACHFMAKQEVFRVPVVGRVARIGGAFPVDRGKADRNAIRQALARLAAGVPVGMYPEGTRSVTLGLQKPFSGAGLIAVQSGVPILPAIITGSERLPFNGKKGRMTAGLRQPDPGHPGVLVRFGAPFTLPATNDGKRLTSEAAAELIMIRLAEMLPPDYRGLYADKAAGADAPVRENAPAV